MKETWLTFESTLGCIITCRVSDVQNIIFDTARHIGTIAGNSSEHSFSWQFNEEEYNMILRQLRSV